MASSLLNTIIQPEKWQLIFLVGSTTKHKHMPSSLESDGVCISCSSQARVRAVSYALPPSEVGKSLFLGMALVHLYGGKLVGCLPNKKIVYPSIVWPMSNFNLLNSLIEVVLFVKRHHARNLVYACSSLWSKAPSPRWPIFARRTIQEAAASMPVPKWNAWQ